MRTWQLLVLQKAAETSSVVAEAGTPIVKISRSRSREAPVAALKAVKSETGAPPERVGKKIAALVATQEAGGAPPTPLEAGPSCMR
jgi:hypothetical protein